ncbi:MAG: transcriptional initiation protein Tat, partial [Chloroflexaceae bacterium]|nr:transcriptional initiation protein Tat [Chloroflexaceae bacterium]
MNKQLTRRELLKGALAGGGFALLAACGAAPQAPAAPAAT